MISNVNAHRGQGSNPLFAEPIEFESVLFRQMPTHQEPLGHSIVPASANIRKFQLKVLYFHFANIVTYDFSFVLHWTVENVQYTICGIRNEPETTFERPTVHLERDENVGKRGRVQVNAANKGTIEFRVFCSTNTAFFSGGFEWHVSNRNGIWLFDCERYELEVHHYNMI